MMGEKIRLDKYLAEMGLGTRSQIKEAAKKGRIKVDGTVEKRTEQKIDPDCQNVSFDGKEISYVKKEYYLLNKPQGVVSATEDKVHKTVLDLIDGKQRKDLFPVGRLDIDTEGLLLITNDGDLAHRLLSPRHHVDKQYYAIVAGKLPEDAPERFRQGIMLSDGTVTMPALLEILEGKEAVREEEPCIEEGTRVLITVREGKFHQIKRMAEALGCRVVYLKRLSMGTLRLDETLRPGEYRALTEEEIRMLREACR